ncbi:MAG: hypothetical protein IKH74_03475 [Lachnospiraceae bacterium]|nr:hypothetical protein [Lachnospiraceae bacterium]
MKDNFKELVAEYMAAWRIADEEKRQTGKVSKETERKLISLEKKLND